MQDAKNRFSVVVDAALAGQPQEVTRRCKPAVVVLSVEKYPRLLAGVGGQRESFAAHLFAFPGELPGRTSTKPRDVTF